MEKFYKAAACTEDELEGGRYSYQKAKGKIDFSSTRDRDEDGFFLPTTEGAVKQYGLMCAVVGVTPLNRKTDIEHSMDYLMKEVYEHDIRALMCDVRLSEYQLLQKFAEEDKKEERENGADPYRRESTESREGFPSLRMEYRRFKDTLSEERRKLLDAVTWKYKWIQLYKKPCFLFAMYTIEELRNWNGMKRFVRLMPEERREFILSSESAFDPEKRICVFDGEPKDKDERFLRFNATLYWREYCRHLERERFREDFIHSYNLLPMANRRLMDTMYELAWRDISYYKFGKAPGHIPMPWYDREDAASGDVACGEAPTNDGVEEGGV